MTYLIILLFLFIIFTLVKLSRYRKIMLEFSRRLQNLEKRVPVSDAAAPPRQPRLTAAEEQDSASEPGAVVPEASTERFGVPRTPPGRVSAAGESGSGKSAPPGTPPERDAALSATARLKARQEKYALWIKLEEQFIENWTGVLGAVIMVMGVGFLVIYTALALSPFYRFLMINGFSLLLAGLFFYLRPKPQWFKLALWLRSSAGAVFLLACIGSAEFPGLKWIDDPGQALLLLLTGVLANLYLGFVGGRQTFASLHVLLSLAAIAAAPQSLLTFTIAGLITLYGIALAYREKWDYNLLITISSFFIYHLFWFFTLKNNGFTDLYHHTGIGTVVLVSLAAALVHYRDAYKSPSLEVLPFITHLINWLYLGVGLFMHVTGSKWKTILILLGAAAAFLLARRAKKLAISWLYQTDTMIAQITVLIATLTLAGWEVSRFSILGILFVEMLLFLTVMIKQGEKRLYRMGSYLLHLIGLLVLVHGFKTINHDLPSRVFENAAVLSLCILTGSAFHIFALARRTANFDTLDYFIGLDAGTKPAYSVLGVTLGIMTLALFANISGREWSEYAILLIAAPLIFLRQKYQSNGLGIGMLGALLGLHLILWSALFLENEAGIAGKLADSIPFALLSFSAITWCYVRDRQQYFKWIGLYLLALHALIVSYFVFEPLSDLLPGTLWLTFSLLPLVSAIRLRQRRGSELAQRGETDRYLLHTGYLFLGAFLVRHWLVHSQSTQSVGSLKIRFLIALLAIAVLLFWAVQKKPSEGKIYQSWIYLHPLFPEIILLFSIYTMILELSSPWYPLLWIVMAFGCLWAGERFSGPISRLRFYALILLWITALQVTFLSGSEGLNPIPWYEHPRFLGSVAILLQFLFLIYAYHHARLENIQLPVTLRFLQPWISDINKYRNSWMFYPVIVGVAVFLWRSFDKSLLTFLFVVECFFIFLLSVVLKERHFRYVALGGVIAALLRLIFYDLSQSDALTRAMVFLGVGIIILIINSIYGKYKDRFSGG